VEASQLSCSRFVACWLEAVRYADEDRESSYGRLRSGLS
jgi:hypothetical protein